MVVPHEGGAGKRNATGSILQPPTDVHIVAGAQEDRIEAANLEQRGTPCGKVAAGHVLRDAVVEEHVIRSAWGARHTLCKPSVVGRHDIRPAGSNDIGRQERLHQMRQP